MNDPSFLGRGWKFPPQLDGGKVAMVGDDESVREAIRTILATPVGERVMNLDFGCRIFELVFAPNNDATIHLASFYIRQALQRWEPRIEVIEVTAAVDPMESEKLLINIDYRIRSKNVRANLVYPFYLQGEER